ncbi:MAG: hypothetical protein L3K14_07165 [Thermoplasmata archaeon]|nr:hypothetical protein [Thermoplasmata archaeon]
MTGSPMGPPAHSEPPPLPWLFFLVAIITAVAVGALIAYLGVTGHLGAGIPGSSPPKGGLLFSPIGGLVLGVGARRHPEKPA